MAEVLTTAAIGSKLSGSILEKLANGIPMGKLSLFLLAIIPFTGVLGMNNAAMGNSSIALLKSSSFLLSGGILSYMIPYYPWFLRTVIVSISFLGPWFIFDILEFIDNPKFEAVGFRLPLNMEIPGLMKEPPNTLGKWTLTTPIALSIAAAFATSGVALANYIPASILPASIASNISLFSGSAGLLLGLCAVGFAVTSAGPPAVTKDFTSIVPMTGGALPPLSQFASKLLKSKSPDESYAFFSVIALVILGGAVTAWSKYPQR